METREPIPQPLLKRILEVGNLAILAGCTADEVIEQCQRVARDHGYGIRQVGKGKTK